MLCEDNGCSDKGSRKGIMSKKEYVEKLLAIVTETNKFITVSKEDETNHCEQRITAILKKLKQDDWTDNKLFERLRPTGSGITRLYGLPKIQRDGVPIGPILSA